MSLSLVVFTDGSCEPKNPNGDIGIGVHFYEVNDLKIITSPINKRDIKTECSKSRALHEYEYAGFFKHGDNGFESTSNNMAEHLAINYAIKKIAFVFQKYTNVFIFSDSDLAIKQMRGEWKIKQGKTYSNTAFENKKILSNNQIENVFFRWIPRELNKKADALSNKHHSVIKEWKK